VTVEGNILKIKLITIIILVISILLISVCCLINKNTNRVVNIVFNTDVNYKDYTKVAIKSAILNKKRNSIYKINIICVNLTKDQQKEFDIFKEKNVTINTIPVDISAVAKFEDYDISHYVTKADLFKFLIPDIFSDLNKILYLDSDILVLGDLRKLYNTNIKDYPLAAVKGMKSQMILEKVNEQGYVYYTKDFIQTYNCGVLLYNLSRWRKDKLKEKLIEQKKNDFYRDLRTQRALNEVIPFSNIKQLSPIYNVYSRGNKYGYKSDYPLWLLNARAVIVHFAGKEKPWIMPDVNFGDKWWEYAKLINSDWKVEKHNIKKYMK